MTNAEKRLLEFLRKYPNELHTYSTDKITLKAVRGLVDVGLAETNEYHQVFLAKGKNKAGKNG